MSTRPADQLLTFAHARQRLYLLAALLLFAGCANFGWITYFDPTTYKNLTDTKPVVAQFYDTLVQDKIDDAALSAIRLKLAQSFEYEKGKGKDNIDIVNQITIIRRMFDRHMNDRLKGKWSKAHMENEKENIMEAFDIAIATEALKNKRK